MKINSFSHILKQIKRTGGKYIIVENDKPVYVIMSWEDYQKESHPSKKTNLSEELIDKINREIALWKEAQDQKRILDEFGTAPDIPQDVDFDYLKDKNLSTDVDIDQMLF